MTYLGMQIMVEGLALAAFGFMHQHDTGAVAQADAPLRDGRRGSPRRLRRAVAAGVYAELSAAEIRERQEFAFEAAVRMRDRLAAQEVWDAGGPDAEVVKPRGCPGPRPGRLPVDALLEDRAELQEARPARCRRRLAADEVHRDGRRSRSRTSSTPRGRGRPGGRRGRPAERRPSPEPAGRRRDPEGPLLSWPPDVPRRASLRAGLTAMVTPFDAEGALDLDARRGTGPLAGRPRLDGLVLAGTTGESSVLTDDERLSLSPRWRRRSRSRSWPGRRPTTRSTRVGLTAQAAALRRRGVLVVTPVLQPAVAGRALASTSGRSPRPPTLPVVLYDIPVRTGRRIAAATVLELIESPEQRRGAQGGARATSRRHGPAAGRGAVELRDLQR